MSLGAKQAQFAEAIALLILYASKRGYRLRFGTAYRDPDHNKAVGGHPRSAHLSRLAVDFMLDVPASSTGMQQGWSWVKDGSHPAWDDLHNYWMLLGGASAIKGDANHFSFEHEGVR